MRPAGSPNFPALEHPKGLHHRKPAASNGATSITSVMSGDPSLIARGFCLMGTRSSSPGTSRWLSPPWPRQATTPATTKLWVDALCINQTDEHEQASQIGKMRFIYSGAWNVIAWLGEERNASNAAFDLLEQFASVTAQSEQQRFGEFQLPSGLFFGHYFYGLNELMQRQYWSRLWIVQELVLGSSAVVVRCGKRTWTGKPSARASTSSSARILWIIKDHLLENEVRRHRPGGSGYDARWATLWLHLVHKDIQVLRPL